MKILLKKIRWYVSRLNLLPWYRYNQIHSLIQVCIHSQTQHFIYWYKQESPTRGVRPEAASIQCVCIIKISQ